MDDILTEDIRGFAKSEIIKKFNILREEYHTMQRRTEKQQRTISLQELRIGALETFVKIHEFTEESHEKEIQSRDAKVLTLEDNVMRLYSANEKLIVEYQKLNHENKNLEEMCDKLRDQYIDLSKKTIQTKIIMDHLLQLAEDANNRINQYREEVSRLKLERNNSNLKAEIGVYKQKIGEQNKTLNTLKTKLTTVKEKHSEQIGQNMNLGAFSSLQKIKIQMEISKMDDILTEDIRGFAKSEIIKKFNILREEYHTMQRRTEKQQRTISLQELRIGALETFVKIHEFTEESHEKEIQSRDAKVLTLEDNVMRLYSANEKLIVEYQKLNDENKNLKEMCDKLRDQFIDLSKKTIQTKIIMDHLLQRAADANNRINQHREEVSRLKLERNTSNLKAEIGVYKQKIGKQNKTLKTLKTKLATVKEKHSEQIGQNRKLGRELQTKMSSRS
ncbi:unnamed protein product [Diabrotica balteata]|uniref:Uncharacterized protein n=1 Tax=Diabrotica balteata TaxID=107213 RepID=A0A9N9SUU8_DIABA|nr:unnamed protein product [Diabrotica balteata]